MSVWGRWFSGAGEGDEVVVADGHGGSSRDAGRLNFYGDTPVVLAAFSPGHRPVPAASHRGVSGRRDALRMKCSGRERASFTHLNFHPVPGFACVTCPQTLHMRLISLFTISPTASPPSARSYPAPQKPPASPASTSYSHNKLRPAHFVPSVGRARGVGRTGHRLLPPLGGA